jgi:hypothetical protein
MNNFGKKLVSMVLVFAIVISLVGTVSASTQRNSMEVGGSIVTVSGNGNNLQLMVDGVVVPRAGNGTFVQEVTTLNGAVYEVQVRGNSIAGATQVSPPQCSEELTPTTVIDGVEYIVLNSDDATVITDEALIAFLDGGGHLGNQVSDGFSGISMLSSPPSNNSTFNLRTSRYSGRAVMSTATVWTPTFTVGPKAQPTNVSFIWLRLPEVIANHTVRTTFYWFTPVDNQWRQQTVNVAFNLLFRERAILADTLMNTSTRFAFQFHRTGTTLSSFNYMVFQ